MATTKKAAAVKAAPAPAAAAPIKKAQPAPEPVETETMLADAYLSDLIYMALLERGEASKVSEIALEINNPRITLPLVRRALGDAARFTLVDRSWNLTARYLDTSRPTERNLAEVLKAAGRPLSISQLATELSAIYNRPSELYLQLLAKLVRNEAFYFKTRASEYGLVEWLPLTDGEELADVLFDNGLTRSALAAYDEAARGISWSDYGAATVALVARCGGAPVPHAVLGVLGWVALGGKYDPRAHLLAALAEPRLVWLAGRKGGRWITRERAENLELLLEERGLALAGEEAEEPAPVAVEAPAEPLEAPAEPEPLEAPAEEPIAEAPPLEIAAADLAAMERMIAERGAPVEAAELLAQQYEVVAGDPSFKTDLETLTARLLADERFLYVGAGRFREPNSLPLFVYTFPDFLSFPDLQFVSMDGEIMDEEIEDEGFVGTLRQEVLSPLAQDAGDDEGRYTGVAPADPQSATIVVKAHHKEIGTFPLCQVPDGFFPSDAAVVEIVLRDAEGTAHDVIVQHELRLAFGLFGIYEKLPFDSGAVLVLHRTPRPFEFRVEIASEPDPQVWIAPARLSDLLELREQAEESGDMATFDIACEILQDYPKGLDFVQLLTEVNIVRRVTRRKLASILSNYYCFIQKAGQNLWRFDAKKRDLGTDRAKRKYIKR